MNFTIFITGGAGFVGSNLAIKLKKKYPDYEIICMDNLKRRGSEANIPRLKEAGVKFIQGDIRNREDFKLVPKFDTLIECSAEPAVLAGITAPFYLINTNLIGTINCLEEVRENKANIIFLSTSRVYPIPEINNLEFVEDETRFSLKSHQKIPGVSEKGISEKFPLGKIRSLYGATKLASEMIINEYIDSLGIKGVINRCGIIAGPWQMGKVDQGVLVFWIAKHIYGGELSYIGYGGLGKQVRDFVHIDDLFDVIDIQIHDIEKYNGEILNIGGGLKNSFSLKELTELCQEITGSKIKIDSIEKERPLDVKLYLTDYSRIKELSGWEPKKGLKQTVEDIANWISENKELLKPFLS
ncbi:MAG: NAD-dependent epimerase/dehydratase family protein [Patescibacteria group bacterium]|nr:NAD-dependent epimerase/dehydratase family protein [Patescibacteria group bacterium]